MTEIKFLETMRFILIAEPTIETPVVKIPQAAPAIEEPRTIESPIQAQKLGLMQ